MPVPKWLSQLLSTEPALFARRTLMQCGVIMFVMGFFLRPPYPFADIVVDAKWLWDIGFSVCGLVVFAASLRPANRYGQMASLVAVMLPSSTRGIAMAINGYWFDALQWALLVRLFYWGWPILLHTAARVQGRRWDRR